jgi:ATP synthase I chain
VLEISNSLLDSAAARLPRWMAAASVAGTLAALVSGHALWAGGFALGAGIAILAYWWLHQAVAFALDAGSGRPPSGTMTKLLIRYPLALGVVAFFYWTGWLNLSAVIAGLFVPLAGAIIECLILVGSSLRSRSA